MKVILKQMRAYVIKQANFRGSVAYGRQTHASKNGVDVVWDENVVQALNHNENKAYIGVYLEQNWHENFYAYVKYEYKDGKLYMYQTNGKMRKAYGKDGDSDMIVFGGAFIISGLSEEDAQDIMFKWPLQLVSVEMLEMEVQKKLSRLLHYKDFEVKVYYGTDRGIYNVEWGFKAMIDTSEHLENETALYELVTENPEVYENYEREFYLTYGPFEEYCYDPHREFRRFLK